MVEIVRFFCTFCSLDFTTNFVLKVHLAKNHGFCYICKLHSGKNEIFEHFENHTFCCKKKQRCGNCYFSARILPSLKNQNSKKIHKCAICLKHFSDKEDLKIHVKKFHDEKWIVTLEKWTKKRIQIICQLCSKIHENYSEYQIHFLSHFQIGNACKKCNESFGDLENHILKMHEKFTPALIKCVKKCHFSTRSLAIFIDHCRAHGEDQETMIQGVSKKEKAQVTEKSSIDENCEIERKEHLTPKRQRFPKQKNLSF